MQSCGDRPLDIGTTFRCTGRSRTDDTEGERRRAQAAAKVPSAEPGRSHASTKPSREAQADETSVR